MMSAFHPIATKQRTQFYVGSVPIASFGTAANRPLLDDLVGAGMRRRYRAAFLNHALATS